MNKYCRTIIFSNKAYNAIIDETFRKNPIETGGILLGHILDNGMWIVMDVIPPGVDSIHQQAYFEYNERFVNYLAESVANKYENKLDLLGLWHRHPGSMDVFSSTDDETNLKYAIQLAPYGAISGLVNVDPNFRLMMRHVSNPLHYDIVDVEVGDDLIPEDYFKLKHYPEKGLHPAPDNEKKNSGTSIGSMSEPKSNKKEETISLSKKINNLKMVLSGAVAIVALVLFLVLYSFQKIAGDDKGKQSILFELVYNVSDNTGVHIKDLTKGTNENFSSEETDADNNQPTNIEPAITVKAVTAVKYSLLVLCILCMGMIFIPLNRKQQIYTISGSCILTLLILILSPIKLSIAFFVYFALLTVILNILTTGTLKCIEMINAYRNLPWYQKKKVRFSNENEAILKIEPKAERSFEKGKLVYTIITDKSIIKQGHTLAYQMIYSKKYLNDGIIQIYLILPELDEMFPESQNISSHIKTDNNGNKYLEFKSDTDEILNGGETINRFYKWIDSYNRLKMENMSNKSNKIE